MHFLEDSKVENLAFSGLSPLVLLSIGVLLIALESLFFSFVLFWFGLAFLIVGAISFFDVSLDLKWQLSLVSIISLALLLFLRAKALEMFLKSKEGENNDNFLNETGYGVIKNEKVFYKATYWDIDPACKVTFTDGEKVFVEKAEKNIAFIKKVD